MFSIFYSERVAHGATRNDWIWLPDHDVQVVVDWRPPNQMAGELCYAGITDRVLYTGLDEYDPFGWGVKYGAWMYDYDYGQLFEIAAHGR